MPQVSCPYSACFECDLQHIVCQAPPGRGSRSARTELSRREGGWPGQNGEALEGVGDEQVSLNFGGAP
jgi:hypothetical protein